MSEVVRSGAGIGADVGIRRNALSRIALQIFRPAGPESGRHHSKHRWRRDPLHGGETSREIPGVLLAIICWNDEIVIGIGDPSVRLVAAETAGVQIGLLRTARNRVDHIRTIADEESGGDVSSDRMGAPLILSRGIKNSIKQFVLLSNFLLLAEVSAKDRNLVGDTHNPRLSEVGEMSRRTVHQPIKGNYRGPPRSAF